MNSAELKKIRILLFDGVELLDFAGPLEVFGVAHYLLGDRSELDIKTISREKVITVSKSNIKIKANIQEENEPFDLLIIPGGVGTRSIINDKDLLSYIRMLISKAAICSSVCTGALVLAKLDLLKDVEVTTHAVGVPLLKELEPHCIINRSKRFIDRGCIITSAGISAGIDMSLYIVEKFLGSRLRKEVQDYMEYQS